GVATMVTGRSTVRRSESREALSARAGLGGCWADAPNDAPRRAVQATHAIAAARKSEGMAAPKVTGRGGRSTPRSAAAAQRWRRRLGQPECVGGPMAGGRATWTSPDLTMVAVGTTGSTKAIMRAGAIAADVVSRTL